MPNMLIFGLGYTATRLGERLRSGGWQVTGTRREAANGETAFDDEECVGAALAEATHVLSTVPPAAIGHDPVLQRYGEAIKNADLQWCGYLSSTGVYGDTGGAWVDENAPTGSGRRRERAETDRRWQSLRGDMRIFRLPGIYGPGRSPLDKVRQGKARRINVSGQVFSRIHVDDIVSAIVASFEGPSGMFNVADDRPAPQHEVIAHAARLLGTLPPPLLSLEQTRLSDAARGFYSENRRIANGKAKRLLGWKPEFPDYRSGLRSLLGS